MPVTRLLYLSTALYRKMLPFIRINFDKLYRYRYRYQYQCTIYVETLLTHLGYIYIYIKYIYMIIILSDNYHL